MEVDFDDKSGTQCSETWTDDHSLYDLGEGEETSVGHFKEISIDILEDFSPAFILLGH
ncbi:hypothetical protein ACP26L_08230 [Paenibacillus sp. S-38]|uniref:hypothetical protein n=1 Tax=Paenibacillus sp. S-38 TaxID=3416710 RepID=UPI003CF435E8